MVKLLIVNCSPDVRRSICTLLEGAGHTVLEASNSAVALGLLHERPAAAFLDIAMPRESGVQLLRRLRQHPGTVDLPATFVTAHPDQVASVVATGMEGTRVIAIPCGKAELLAAVDEMVCHRHRRRSSMRVRLTGEPVMIGVEGSDRVVARNLSRGGAFLLLPRRLPVGDRINATIFFEQKTVTIATRVTHVQQDGVGVAFAEPSPDALRFVEDIIEKMLSDGRATEERRGEVRQPVSAAIIFTEGGESRPAHIRDLSSTGAYVVTIEPPPISQSTLVYLPGYAFSEGQPTPSELRGCTAEVIRHGHDGFGCRFVSPSAEFSMAVAELLRKENADATGG